MEAQGPTLVLACDHRGNGLATAFSALKRPHWRVEATSSVVASLAQARALRPDVLVLDPLVEGGRAELETILGNGPDGERPAVLLMFDPTRADAALYAKTVLELTNFDLAPRGASSDEIALRVERLIEERRRERELVELRHAAVHDDGTGLLRSRAFGQRLVEHFSAAQRHTHDIALVIVDLDRFGAVNKTFDHVVGDRILARVGEAVRAALRAEDVAGRIGGDEFAVLLPYTKKVDAAHVSMRLLQEIRSVSGRFEGASQPIRVSTSLGFETFDGRDLDDVDTLRAHAELALRAAKKAGGDRGIYYRSLRL
ncbi:MAG: GGDEF domain-containing protein [Planctomycetota bacterium]|nr:GGDEF domain-containing protein [Planctomycetota bacterium]